jgi:hypothetical protein
MIFRKKRFSDFGQFFQQCCPYATLIPVSDALGVCVTESGVLLFPFKSFYDSGFLLYP